MSDKNHHQFDDADEQDAVEFLKLARQAVAEHDPAPDEYKQFSRLSFEFRGLPSAVEVEGAEELVGSRASTDSGTQLVEHLGSQLRWTVDGSNLVGVISPDKAVHVDFEASSGDVVSTVSDVDGVFAFDVLVPGPHRLIVRDDMPWASPWFVP